MFQEDKDNQIATIGWILQDNDTNIRRYIYQNKEKLPFNKSIDQTSITRHLGQHLLLFFTLEGV